jgi:hypothetical protein
MPSDQEYTLHRKKHGAESDRMIARGPRDEMLRQYLNTPSENRDQYFLMLCGMRFNHLEIDSLVRQAGLDKQYDD